MMTRRTGDGEKETRIRWQFRHAISYAFCLSIFLVIMSSSVFALEDISITKEIEASYKAGEPVHVTYAIDNPFNQKVKGILTDTSVMGERGFRIECLELQIPAQAKGRLDLVQEGLDTRFPAPDEGTYHVGNVTFTYRHPELDIITQSTSGPFEVETQGSSSTDANISVHNLCNDKQQKQQKQQQQQKKSQKSEEEARKEQQESEKRIEQQQKEMQQRKEQMSQQDKKVSQAQSRMNQDTKATKKAMQKALERRKRQEQSMKEALSKSQDVQKAREQMQKEGFSQTNQSLTPRGNKTGDFSYEFRNATGGKESIKGRMENGSISELADSRKMKKQLQQNERYRKLQEKLRKKGYERKEFTPKDEHRFSERWEDEHGNTQTISHHKDTNLTTARDFSVKADYAEDYVLRQLENDTRYRKLKSRMEGQGLATEDVRVDGPTSYVTFEGDNISRKVYFTEPRIFDEGFLGTIWKRIRLGWVYLFGRG